MDNSTQDYDPQRVLEQQHEQTRQLFARATKIRTVFSPIPTELLEAAAHCPTIRAAISLVESGHCSLEHALTRAAVTLSEANRMLLRHATELAKFQISAPVMICIDCPAHSKQPLASPQND